MTRVQWTTRSLFARLLPQERGMSRADRVRGCPARPQAPSPQPSPGGRGGRSRRAAGFNLMEVMVAMGVFAIGFTTVVALFPLATLLQRQTMDEIQSQNYTDTATAMLNGRPFQQYVPGHTDLNGITTDTTIQPISLTTFWSLTDRSGPSTISDPTQRRYLWVPVIRSTKTAPASGNDWQVFAFVLRNDGGAYPRDSLDSTPTHWANYNDGLITSTNPITASVPGVQKILASASGANFTVATPTTSKVYLNVGDQILDENGIVYNVAGVTTDTNGNDTTVTVVGNILPNTVTSQYPAAFWYAPPAAAGKPSPILRIIPVSNAVK